MSFWHNRSGYIYKNPPPPGSDATLWRQDHGNTRITLWRKGLEVDHLEIDNIGEHSHPDIDAFMDMFGTGVGDEITYDMTFAYGDGSPELIATIPANALIVSAAIYFFTRFDGVGAALKIGDVVDNDRIMSNTDNDPGDLFTNTYITHPNVKYAMATPVSLYITPGAGATSGNGLVSIDVISE